MEGRPFSEELVKALERVLFGFRRDFVEVASRVMARWSWVRAGEDIVMKFE